MKNTKKDINKLKQATKKAKATKTRAESKNIRNINNNSNKIKCRKATATNKNNLIASNNNI